MENTTEEKPELSFNLAGNAGEILITFADGEKLLPEYIVNGLGGADKIKEVAESFAGVTYSEFLAAFHKTLERQQLNDFGQNFINSHFNRRRF